jgi:carboxymethylenebutenolidase
MAKTIEEIGGSFEYHIYPGAPHAFFNDTRPSYRVDAARDAWARLLGFFAERLGRP